MSEIAWTAMQVCAGERLAVNEATRGEDSTSDHKLQIIFRY